VNQFSSIALVVGPGLPGQLAIASEYSVPFW